MATTTIRVFAIADQEDLRYTLKAKLSDQNIALLGFAKYDDAAMEKVMSFLPDAVILIADGNGEALKLARELYVAFPGCAILLMDKAVDLLCVQRAMLCGVRKVLPLQCDSAELVESIRISSQMERSHTRRGEQMTPGGSARIITVFGSKGGIGKSTVVSNLSVCLARTGKRVAVVDLDLQFGDVNLFFDVDPKDTIADLVQQNIDIETIKSYLQPHASRVNLLCAPKSPELAETIQAGSVEKIINTMRPYFDYVLLDTPPYFNDISIVAIENADEVLQIVTLDISTLRNTKISLDLLESLQQREKVSIIVNRDTSGLITQKDAQHILDCPIRFRITCDWKTAISSLNRGVPLVSDAPRSVIAREFQELSDMIAGTERSQNRSKARR